MDELLGLRLLGGLGMAGGGFDLAALFFFIAVAIVYLIVPVIGYRPERRGGLIAALYILVGYGVLSLIHTLVMWTQMLGGPGMFGRSEGMHVLMTFSVIKMCVFLSALMAFISGLRSLRLAGPALDD